MAVVVVDKDNFLDQAQGKEMPSERMDEKELHQPVGRRERARADDTAKEVKESKEPVKEVKSAPSDETGGLTPEEYALLTVKQQAAVNKRHRAMKEADEFAEEQYRERKAAERRADDLQRKLDEREAGKPKQAEVKEPDPKEFTNEKGEFDAFGYAKALAKHAAEEAVKADRETQAKLNKEAAEAAAYREYLARVKASTKDIPDWAEVAEEAGGMTVSGAVTGYLRESDAPGPLLYHLAKHPDVLERLNALPTIKALAETAKLEASLSKEPVKSEPIEKERARAPEPIKPLANGDGRATQKDPRDMSLQDHIDDEYKLARQESARRKRH